jgi:hypothetical protein
MSFDIARTPTLQAVATLDPHLLVEDLQQRVDAAVQQAEELPEVAAAVEVLRQAEDRLTELKKAERALNQFSREASQKLMALREASLDTLIQAAGRGEKLEFKPLSELAAMETRNRQASRAIERLVERLIPGAQLLRLRGESHAHSARARALEHVAQERAEKLLGQMREAVSEEVVLPVDMSKGVSGALLAQASEWKHRAVQLSENADAIEKSIEKNMRGAI